MSVVITMPAHIAPQAHAAERIHDNDLIIREALVKITELRDSVKEVYSDLAKLTPRHALEESAVMAARTDLRLCCDEMLRCSAEYLRQGLK